jgi:hypothetical protein
MKKSLTALIIAIFLTMAAGCSNEDQPVAPVTDTDTSSLAIKLGPRSSEYPIDDIFSGDIQFAVSVENTGDSEITFAHPVICFPEEYRIGNSLDLRVHHGNSEILLTVEKPNGDVSILRDGPHFFNPDRESYFFIEPGRSDIFYIGWFFQNAQGGWENDIRAENVFNGRGKYTLKLLYRNFFPKALIHDSSAGKSRFMNVWTGEMQSNEITVIIK